MLQNKMYPISAKMLRQDVYNLVSEFQEIADNCRRSVNCDNCPTIPEDKKMMMMMMKSKTERKREREILSSLAEKN